MEKIRNNRYGRLAVGVIKLLLLVFMVYVTVRFIQTASMVTLLLIGGIILSWRIWKFMFKLLWLLVQIAIFLGVLYLLVV